MTFDEVRAVIFSLPGVEEGRSYGFASFKVNGKFLTRLRDEDESLVLLEVNFDERELLIEAEPATFHITDHYRSHPSVLARIGPLDPARLRGYLERRWRRIAPRALVKAHDAGAGTNRPDGSGRGGETS